MNDREICPGVTVGEHAHSLAMWELHNMPVGNATQQLAVAELAMEKEEAIYNGADVD